MTAPALPESRPLQRPRTGRVQAHQGQGKLLLRLAADDSAIGGSDPGWETTSAIMHVEPAELAERPLASA